MKTPTPPPKAVATAPHSPPAMGPREVYPSTFDAALDPLPQPEVVESDSDTAWARWKDVVEGGAESPGDDVALSHFPDTVPMVYPDEEPPRAK
ncbi:hypothetical protein [Rhodoferax aquaticus]|uniref:Uncharacterized protein n=1 Tax=Rhodoferax aquaticus TaxID=2527691 RepID=A0A515EL52_9BURK|nr:hypothetical protein [Rhodoferax aquaticus]QDL53391.1 hypothetical protein EXZ61_03915 [Rhodoferax aquaticus]